VGRREIQFESISGPVYEDSAAYPGRGLETKRNATQRNHGKNGRLVGRHFKAFYGGGPRFVRISGPVLRAFLSSA